MGSKMTLVIVPVGDQVGLYVAQHEDTVDIKEAIDSLNCLCHKELSIVKPGLNTLCELDESIMESRGIYKLEPLVQPLSDGRYMLGGLLFDHMVVLGQPEICVTPLTSAGK